MSGSYYKVTATRFWRNYMDKAENPNRITSVLSGISVPPTAGPLAALLLAGLFFSFQSDRFLTGSNLSLVMQQVVVVGTLAIGQTLIIITAGIDLSNGMIMALSQVWMAGLFISNGLPAPVAILAGFAIGAL